MTYGLYVGGVKKGETAVELIDGHNVAIVDYRGKPIADAVKTLKAAALKDGIHLIVGSGLRTQDEQIAIRKNYVKDKSKVNDMAWIMGAASKEFSPVAAPPGWSNHQNGSAIDFNLTGYADGYKWMINHAHGFGWIRTVASKYANGKLIAEGERWHWEFLPGSDMFSVVPKTDPTWDNLI